MEIDHRSRGVPTPVRIVQADVWIAGHEQGQAQGPESLCKFPEAGDSLSRATGRRIRPHYGSGVAVGPEGRWLRHCPLTDLPERIRAGRENLNVNPPLKALLAERE